MAALTTKYDEHHRPRTPEEPSRLANSRNSSCPFMLLPRKGVAGSGRHSKKRKVVGNMDLPSGAQPKAIGAVLVTINEREFARIEGFRIENWAASTRN